MALADTKPVVKKSATDVMSVTLTPEVEQGVLKSLRVETHFRGDADGETVFLLPKPPGGETKPWEDVSDMRAVGADLSGDDPNERILKHRPGAPVTVSYRVARAASDEPFLTLIKPTYFSTLGWEIFSDLKDREPAIYFKWGPVPMGWSVASDLDHANGGKGLTFGEYKESALMGGSDIVVEERRVGAGRLRVAMHRDSGLEPRDFVDLVARLAQTSNTVWQDPGSDFFITLTTLDFGGQAGLGLGDAYALYLPRNPDQFELRNTLAHEHLHSWVARRLGGGNAWFREGLTEYLARLVNLRAGAYSVEDFARRWNAALLRYANSPLRLATDAEADPIFLGNNDAERIAEDRGSMMAALLDYRLRNGSNGKVNLTDLLVRVKQEFDAGRGEGDGPARLVKTARDLSGIDLQRDIDRHLVRGEELLLPADLFADCATVATIDLPKYDRGFAKGSFGKAVEGVDPESRAYAAGLRDGMVLVKREEGAVGDSRVELVYRVKDGSTERLIRYRPAGKGIVRLQEIRLQRGLAAAAAAECATSMSGS
jgi:predicted metalloprotease with PDZ domain